MSSKYFQINSSLLGLISSFMGGFVVGCALSYFVNKKKNLLKIKSKEISSPKSPKSKNKLSTMDKNLIREQLKRNYEFFGEEGMKGIKDSFVVVVGIGGVGR